MSLLDLWEKSPDELLNKRLWQIIAIAGGGKLVDGAEASVELRKFLSRVPLDAFGRWAREAVEGKFDGSGLALQDIVNEIGQRLGFAVRFGGYRGSKGESYDGIWQAKTGHSIVVETKTSDTYIDLKKLAEYRNRLIHSKKLGEGASSMLVVIGRQDTGDSEERIRGSRYAFDMRVVTVEGLLRLLAMKDAVTDERSLATISGKIFELFVSPKFVNLDPALELLAGTPQLPATNHTHKGQAREELGANKGFDPRMAEAVLSVVRAGGSGGARRRNLQRRFHRLGPKRFGDILDSLCNSLRLRVEKRGRRILVMLGEGELKSEFLLYLAELYEKDKRNQGLGPGDFAVQLGFPPEIGERVAAELRAEGAAENVAGVPGVIRLTGSGYQKYLPEIRALRALRGGAG